MTLKCRQGDVELLQSQVDDAIAEYKEKMLSEVKKFQGQKDIKCKVNIDQSNFLPEYDSSQTDSRKSCLGGFEIYAKKNRIVCSQTLDARMDLVYAQAIPDIRKMLFPSLAKRQ